MRYLILTHRWLGVAVCLLFAMWFATGMVMHFVPFPSLSLAERLAGLSPMEGKRIVVSLGQAALAIGNPEVSRVRLVMRGSRPEYVFNLDGQLKGVFADDGSIAHEADITEALQLALAHARNRGIPTDYARYAELADYDQWTVPNGLDAHRPLHRVQLGDADGTELYVSSVTGEVVRDTTRFERAWNYAGSVVHWIYPTFLRKDWKTWDSIVWWASFVALLSAVTGIIVGILRARWRNRSRLSPYRRMMKWHHLLGLGAGIFVLTYIFSGWLSMDHDRLFSGNEPSATEVGTIQGGVFRPDRFDVLPLSDLKGAREIDFILLGNHPYLRLIQSDARQLILSKEGVIGPYFSQQNVRSAAERISVAYSCFPPEEVAKNDYYYSATEIEHAPLHRLMCNDRQATWWHIDSAQGRITEKVDSSRRAYRWLYSALHTFDLPWLDGTWRTIWVVTLCSVGLLFSLTGVVIGWRRLTQ